MGRNAKLPREIVELEKVSEFSCLLEASAFDHNLYDKGRLTDFLSDFTEAMWRLSERDVYICMVAVPKTITAKKKKNEGITTNRKSVKKRRHNTIA
jgi:hypothetical protein